MKNSEIKNILIAVVLSFAILQGWYFFFPAEKPQDIPQDAPIADTGTQSLPPEATHLPLPEIVSSPIAIQTPTLTGEFDRQGSKITHLFLEQHDTELKSAEPVTLLTQAPAKRYDITLGWLQQTGPSFDGNTLWQGEEGPLTPDQPLTLKASQGGVEITREIAIDADYMLTVTDTLTSLDGQSHTLYPYGVISRMQPQIKSMFISHEGPVSVLNGSLEEESYKDVVKDGPIEVKDTSGWFGISDKYWLTALIPDNTIAFDASLKAVKKEAGQLLHYSYRGQAMHVTATTPITTTQHVFMGAKHLNLLDQYAEQYDIPLFDRAIDFGWLYFITKPTSQLLNWIHPKVGNFGIAIIVLTILVRLLLFPVANKSFKSMARMKQVMPELQAIRERYKNDRMKLNQEMMKLYKEKRINPMSGCLPLLLQIPVLFALYKVLYVTIEMRHAPFFAWVKDLSAPDPTNILNLFGLIPLELPAWLPVIGIWPILFAASMWLQQSLNPKPTDATQAAVMKWLPVILLFVFAGFPAGLVLYWTWSNLLSILQQWVITRQINKAL